jgi:phosphate-selective porin OprO/OprP
MRWISATAILGAALVWGGGLGVEQVRAEMIVMPMELAPSFIPVGQTAASFAAEDTAKDAQSKAKDGADKKKENDTKKKEDGDEKKREAAAKIEQPYEIGTDLSVKAVFKEGLFLWLETPHKDFTMHLGAWLNWDNVWWSQSPALVTPPDGRPGPDQGVATGVAMGGIGYLQDGTFFRRIRPFAEGTFWENGEYRLSLAVENIQFTTTGLDESWVGATNLPMVETVRVGHVKCPMGLEGDMMSSSRCMTFMERSAYSDAIELGENFVSGIWGSDNYLDQRITWQAALFRPDRGTSADFFGTGQYGWQARLTGLPLYADEGRHLLHLGISGGWRTGTTDQSLSALRVVQLRARPELRDDTPSGAQSIPNGNSSRMVDTGVLALGSDFRTGLEALYILGPFSAQAEYGWNWVNQVTGVFPTYSTSSTTFLAFDTPQNYMFNGGYVQLAYTLTGENRAYDRRFGTLAREYYGRQGPYTKAFLVRDADGHLCVSWGAWEVAARYSYVNLNDGNGLTAIRGGALQGLTLALNWYVNNNLNVMMDWAHDYRYNLPEGVIPGHTDGFGIRVQFQF